MFKITIQSHKALRIYRLVTTILPSHILKAAHISKLMAEKLRIVFEDEHIIAIDKPADILTVPGKKFTDKESCFLPRHEQWMASIAKLASLSSTEQFCKDILNKLILDRSVPRKKDRFLAYLKKVVKIDDASVCETVWKELSEADFSYNYSLQTAKPPNLLSITEMLEHIYQKRVFHCHRLDMETSGIIVFAKSEEACAELCRQFREKEVSKTYLAKVVDRVSDGLKRIETPIRSDLTNRPYQIVDLKEGKPSCTEVSVVEYSDIHFNVPNDFLEPCLPQKRLKLEALLVESNGSAATGSSETETAATGNPYLSLQSTSSQLISNGASLFTAPDKLVDHSTSQDLCHASASVGAESRSMIEQSLKVTLVKLKPITGRTHQLRVHMAHSGHPILGDSLYAPPLVRMASKRLCLHAQSITFKHPATGEVVTLTAQNCDFLD